MTKREAREPADGLKERRLNERLARWTGWLVAFLALCAGLLFLVMWMSP